jgi:hypothetical protein
MADIDGGPSFSDDFDDELALGVDGSKAYFGRDVLRGLIEGLDDFAREPRWQRSRSAGSVLLGSAMWIDDEDLMHKLEELSGACIVVTKQGRKPHKLQQLERLHAFNDRMPGLPIRAFPALGGLAPKVDGQPLVVGPYDRWEDAVLPTLRTLGFRGERLPPIVHAKLALLGDLWWHDEGPLGHVEDVIGFTPRRLWISSANFTSSSRRSLEFGYWTGDPGLLDGAEWFLLGLIRSSEDLDPDANFPDPSLAPVDFDDAAMAEALNEADWDDADADDA